MLFYYYEPTKSEIHNGKRTEHGGNSIYCGSLKENQIYPPPRNRRTSIKTPPILHPKTTNPPPRKTPGNVEKKRQKPQTPHCPIGVRKRAKN
jgi:hypothetical protein